LDYVRRGQNEMKKDKDEEDDKKGTPDIFG